MCSNTAIPFDSAQTTSDPEHPHEHSLEVDINGELQQFSFVPVSMGNPHAVIFCTDILNTDVAAIGAALTNHPAFPEGANIGFCQVVDPQFVRLRVYERGVGETRACGSGACAAVVAARLLERVNPKVKVSLPGGKLRIAWSDQDAPVTMTGNATLVYAAEL